MAVIKCKMCGGDMEISADKTYGTCEYCGCQMTLPRVDDDQRAAAFNRGNHFRRIGEFDKALAVYERIVREDENDAEAHWCSALCRFGIEYVEDPSTYEWIPTCHRASFDNFLEDVDYLAAVEHSEGITKRQYQRDGAKIAEVQRGILATSQNEEPYDVFICYKETDEDGERTRDSAMAQDIYYQLTEQGRRVFFARITLEDKVGTEYEPYIFAALNSAKVMVVVGTQPEHLNAVWVKNEWSRFLAMMKHDRSKLLLPCYRDMDPYDLPEQLSVLQSYDMSKIGFIQDLTRGISKVLDADKKPEPTVVQQVGGVNVASLLDRGFMALEDQEWNKADGFFEEVLNQDARCGRAYLGKLFVSMKASTVDSIAKRRLLDSENCQTENVTLPTDEVHIQEMAEKYEVPGQLVKNQIKDIYRITNQYPVSAPARKHQRQAEETFWNGNRIYLRAVQFADPKQKGQLEQMVTGLLDRMDARIEEAMQQDELAKQAQEKAYADHMTRCDKKLENQWNAIQEKIAQEEEAARIALEREKARQEAEQREKRMQADYRTAVQYMHDKNYRKASEEFEKLSGYRDSHAMAEKCRKTIQDAKRKNRSRLLAALLVIGLLLGCAVAFSIHRTAMIQSSYENAQILLKEGDNVGAAIQFGKAGDYQDAREQSFALWDEIAHRDTISAGFQFTVGVRNDGTVASVGDYTFDSWTDIVAISAGIGYVVGLRSDGTVVARNNDYDVGRWTDIVAISAGDDYTVGLRSDGTVVTVGTIYSGQCDTGAWTDIVAISAGDYHTVALRSDGTAVAVGENYDDRCEVGSWTDLVAISAGCNYTVGLRSDGTVVAVGGNYEGQCDTGAWTDIVAVSAGNDHTVGLRSDGTVVAVGDNFAGQCDTGAWTDIVAVSAGIDYTLGLRSDGTVVSIGSGVYGHCDTGDWTDIRIPE